MCQSLTKLKEAHVIIWAPNNNYCTIKTNAPNEFPENKKRHLHGRFEDGIFTGEHVLWYPKFQLLGENAVKIVPDPFPSPTREKHPKTRSFLL